MYNIDKHRLHILLIVLACHLPHHIVIIVHRIQSFLLEQFLDEVLLMEFSFLAKEFSFIAEEFSFIAEKFSFLAEEFSFIAEEFSFMAEEFSFIAEEFSFLDEEFSFFLLLLPIYSTIL